MEAFGRKKLKYNKNIEKFTRKKLYVKNYIIAFRSSS